MVALGIGQSEATRLVHLADRLANLPEVWQAWSAGVLDASRVRVLADATEVLDDATARAVADQVLAWAGDGPWAGLAPRQWRTRVQEAVVRADAGAAARRRAAAVAARRVRSWAEGDGSAVLTVHAGKADIEMADQVISDLALFGDGPAADATAQLRGLGCPDAVDPVSARALPLRHLRDGIGVQVLVVDGTGVVQHVVRIDRDTARSCGSRETLLAAVRQAIADAPTWEVQGHDPSEAIARHVRAAAPTCSFYDCPRQARSCDLDHDTPWPRGPTSVTNLDPKCRRHHNAKTLGVARTRLTAGPGAGPRTVHWTLP